MGINKQSHQNGDGWTTVGTRTPVKQLASRTDPHTDQAIATRHQGRELLLQHAQQSLA